MSLYFEGRAVGRLFLDAGGRPAAFAYDPRWLATPGAFPISRWVPLCGREVSGPRLADWGARLSLDGAAPFDEPLSSGPTKALFGPFDLQRDQTPTAGAEARARMRVDRGPGLAEDVAFARVLGGLIGFNLTPWRMEASSDGGTVLLDRADRLMTDGRARRSPVELVAFGRAPLRCATLFRRLDGVLDAPCRLALFDRLVFAALLGVDAPATVVRLDGAPRLAPIGADWTGAAPSRDPSGAKALDAAAWRAFAKTAGLNPTFAPRRVVALAEDMRLNALEAIRRAAAAAPALDWPTLEARRERLDQRLDRVCAWRVGESER